MSEVRPCVLYRGGYNGLMIIMGIDPGLAIVGYGIVEYKAPAPSERLLTVLSQRLLIPRFRTGLRSFSARFPI